MGNCGIYDLQKFFLPCNNIIHDLRWNIDNLYQILLLVLFLDGLHFKLDIFILTLCTFIFLLYFINLTGILKSEYFFFNILSLILYYFFQWKLRNFLDKIIFTIVCFSKNIFLAYFFVLYFILYFHVLLELKKLFF